MNKNDKHLRLQPVTEDELSYAYPHNELLDLLTAYTQVDLENVDAVNEYRKALTNFIHNIKKGE